MLGFLRRERDVRVNPFWKYILDHIDYTGSQKNFFCNQFAISGTKLTFWKIKLFSNIYIYIWVYVGMWIFIAICLNIYVFEKRKKSKMKDVTHRENIIHCIYCTRHWRCSCVHVIYIYLQCILLHLEINTGILKYNSFIFTCCIHTFSWDHGDDKKLNWQNHLIPLLTSDW